MNGILKSIVERSFSAFGLNVARRQNSPTKTLLGLASIPFTTIIDVGANVGQFGRGISKIFPNATLYCFEPLPGPFASLSTWAKTRNGRVVPFNVALSDKAGMAEMFLHKEHTASSSLLPTTMLNEEIYPFTREQERISVRQMTLDGALDEAKVSRSSSMLIKLDVQGYEDRVIAGGTETFAAATACIVEVCLDSLYAGQAGFFELLAMLDSRGFRYAGNLDQCYGKDGHCIFLDAVFVRRAQ
jgi:FkbM family methyltransferase